MRGCRVASGLVAALAISTAPVQSYGQTSVATAFAADMAVSSAAGELKAALTEVIQQAEQSLGISSFRVRQDAAFLIAEIDNVVRTNQGRLMRDLSVQQRDLFNHSRALVHDVERSAGRTLNSADQVARTLEDGISSLPFGDRQPLVRRTSPVYRLAATTEAVVRVDATGRRLAHSASTMRVGGQICTPIGRTDSSLSFNCAATAFAAIAQPTTVVADLAVPIPKGFWDTVLFRRPPDKRYQIPIVVMPPRMGRYTVSANYIEDEREEQARTGLINANNSHCQGEREHGPFRFSTTTGWQIDPASIRTGDRSGNQQRSSTGPHDVSGTGFYYLARLRNGGDCGPKVPFTNRRAWVDARASIHQEVFWSEYRIQSRERSGVISEGDLAWGVDKTITLPPQTHSVQISIEQADGQTRTVLGTDASNDWFTVDVDAARLNAVIRPRHLDDALAR